MFRSWIWTTAFVVTSRPRRLTRLPMTSIGSSVAWSRDGRSVIFSAYDRLTVALYRVSAAGDAPPERIEMAGLNDAAHPATVASRDRLAFSNWGLDLDTCTDSSQVSRHNGCWPRRGANGIRSSLATVITSHSCRRAQPPARSGLRMRMERGPAPAHCTVRESGRAHRIGHRMVNRLPSTLRASDGHWHIWTIDAEGGAPRQLTRGDGNQNVPTWSQDGRWIYFRRM